jgi:hypothetical protein
VGAYGAGGFAGEAEGLAADLGNAVELALGERKVTGRAGGKILLFAEQKQDVGDGLQRVIDLVGDGGGKAADGDELLIFPQHHCGAVELVLGLALENDGLAHLERPGQHGGQVIHFTGLQDFGRAVAQKADGIGFGDAVASKNDRDGRLRGASPFGDLADVDVGKAFRSGHEKVGGAAVKFVEELAAVLRKFDGEREPCPARGRADSMMRQRGAAQHEDCRNGLPSHMAN